MDPFVIFLRERIEFVYSFFSIGLRPFASVLFFMYRSGSFEIKESDVSQRHSSTRETEKQGVGFDHLFKKKESHSGSP